MAVMVGCLDMRVHVYACLCACRAACLTCWWLYLRRAPCWSGRNKGQFSAPPPPPSPPLVLIPQGCGRNTVSSKGLWALSGRKSSAGLREKRSSVACPVALPSPFPVHHILAAASWTLTENRRIGCQACRGGWRWGWGVWTYLPPSFPTGAHWCLRCSLSLGLYPSLTLNWDSNFPLECVEVNVDLEYGLGPALCLSETPDALRGTFQL